MTPLLRHIYFCLAFLITLTIACSGDTGATEPSDGPAAGATVVEIDERATPLAPSASQTPAAAELSTSTPQAIVPTPLSVPEMRTYIEVEGWGVKLSAGIVWARPNGIAIDSENNIFTTEFQGNRIRKLSPDGELLLEWGITGTGNGEFQAPTGIAVGPNGNVFVSESGGASCPDIFTRRDMACDIRRSWKRAR
jgi:DNA-binding beta-propeller fold protein YncE